MFNCIQNENKFLSSREREILFSKSLGPNFNYKKFSKK